MEVILFVVIPAVLLIAYLLRRKARAVILYQNHGRDDMTRPGAPDR